MAYQLRDPNISINEDILVLAISNARTAQAWDSRPANTSYWQGQIDAYTSLLKGLL